MKQTIAAVTAVLLLCSSPAAFAQDAAAGGTSTNPGQAQAALEMLNSMTPEQRQQVFSAGVAQVDSLTPEQLKQLRAQFDSMTPDQKAQMEAQITQMMNNSPQLKAQAQQQLQKLTPSQQQQLGGTDQ
jgi:hypothetical protein